MFTRIQLPGQGSHFRASFQGNGQKPSALDTISSNQEWVWSEDALAAARGPSTHVGVVTGRARHRDSCRQTGRLPRGRLHVEPFPGRGGLPPARSDCGISQTVPAVSRVPAPHGPAQLGATGTLRCWGAHLISRHLIADNRES